jgi:hypothetical protein
MEENLIRVLGYEYTPVKINGDIEMEIDLSIDISYDISQFDFPIDLYITIVYSHITEKDQTLFEAKIKGFYIVREMISKEYLYNYHLNAIAHLQTELDKEIIYGNVTLIQPDIAKVIDFMKKSIPLQTIISDL